MAPRSTNSIYPGDAFSKMIETGSGILKVLKTPDKRTRNGKLVLGPRMTVRVPCSANRGVTFGNLVTEIDQAVPSTPYHVE